MNFPKEEKIKISDSEYIRIGYHENGSKNFEFYYKDEQITGKAIVWYETGSIMSESTIGSDHFMKRVIQFFENGVKSHEINFKKGKRSGDYIRWDESGELLSKGLYKDGKKYSGKFVKRYVNGNMYTEENYLDGNMHGNFLKYSPDGSIISKKIFNNGKQILSCAIFI